MVIGSAILGGCKPDEPSKIARHLGENMLGVCLASDYFGSALGTVVSDARIAKAILAQPHICL